MRSSPETTTRTTGAHRAHREARDRTAARAVTQRPPAAQRPSTRYAAYDAYLDGLFTYCLSVLCDHDAATAALGDVLALAERRGHRAPASAADHRAWLYALARWSCLRKLAEAKQKRPSSHAAGRPAPPATSATTTPDEAHQRQRQRHRSELALLAWPEAAGTTPEQREALELAVRHHLAPHEVAAVLGTDLAATRELLASAACEVERTRAALAVVETGTCAGVARLTGDNRYVLSSALRRELVRHVDDCPRCRRTAERAVPGRWPGTSVTPAELPVLEAPRSALHGTPAHTRARGSAPRFDRRGFPMDPKDRAARRDRLRARAVTTTVVATVVAAPVLALWAAYRGTPVVEGEEGRPASASEAQDPDGLEGESAGGGYGYENAGNASTTPGTGFGENGEADVSVEVVGVSGAGKGAGRLGVTAGHDGDITLVTLTATGDAPVRWSVSVGASWLYLSRSAGTLRPGEAVTVRVYVDHLREPSGHWSARVAVSPAGAVVAITGYGPAPAPSRPDPRPGTPGGTTSPSHPGQNPDPSPSQPTDPDPTPTDDPPPTSPDPDPTATEPSPTGGPDGSSPPPSDGDSGTPSPSGS
ncbi:BACON domain-containing protein [Streptomyces violaceorubidus]